MPAGMNVRLVLEGEPVASERAVDLAMSLLHHDKRSVCKFTPIE
jgi:hypothetical protein